MIHRSALLLGCDRYVVAACGRHEVEAVLIYGPAHKDWNGLPDIPPSVTPIFVESHGDPEAVLSGLRRHGLGSFHPGGIQTTDEFSIVNAGLLGKQLGSRAIDPDVAVSFRDKFLQKEIVARAGILTADSVVIDDMRDLLDDAFISPAGSVVKPLAGGGTSATARVRDIQELRAFADGLRRDGSPHRTFILESFVTGEEWVADGVVVDGKVVFYCVGCYDEPCLSAVTGERAVCMRRFDPCTDSDVYDHAKPVVFGALKALGLRDGVFHMELFHDKNTGKTYFSECAARRGGGMTQEEVMAKFNVDLGEQALMAMVGTPAELDVRVDSAVIGMTFLACQPGILVSCPSAADLEEAFQHVEFAQIELPFGQSMGSGVLDTTVKIGSALIKAPTVLKFDATVLEVQQWFDDRVVVVPPDRTKAELFVLQQAGGPDDRLRHRLYRY